MKTEEGIADFDVHLWGCGDWYCMRVAGMIPEGLPMPLPKWSAAYIFERQSIKCT